MYLFSLFHICLENQVIAKHCLRYRGHNSHQYREEFCSQGACTVFRGMKTKEVYQNKNLVAIISLIWIENFSFICTFVPVILLIIFPAFPHYPILKPPFHIWIFVAAVPHLQVSKLISVSYCCSSKLPQT